MQAWRTSRWTWAALAGGALAVGVSEVLARAGGGEGYSGGSSGGGGAGGDGGDGLGQIIYLLIRLSIAYPAVGLPITGLFVAFLIYSAYKGKSAYQTSVIHRAVNAVHTQRRDTNLRAMLADDPAFDAGRFLGRVRVAFVKIQEAWMQQELSRVRAFISDGVHERFSLQFDEQRFLGVRNIVENVRIDGVEIAAVEVDDHFEEVSVRIRAAASDYRVSLADGRRLSGSTAIAPFSEIWSFLRRKGTVSRTDRPGLIEGNCPNCGGAIEMNQSAKCKYCGAALRSGEYDWVLSEITQECEWRPGLAEGRRHPGVHAMRSTDPGFNVQQIEDTASVMFWRHRAAERLSRIDPLCKVATDEFCREYAQQLAERAGPGGQRSFFGQCAIGSVQLMGVLRGEPLDRAVVEVRWSGTRYTAGGDQVAVAGQTVLSRSLLVLSRAAGAQSDLGLAISSAHCPGCGAPETGGTSGACEFCGAAMNDLGRWTLSAAVSAMSTEGHRLIQELNATRDTVPIRVVEPAAPAAFATPTGVLTAPTESPHDAMSLLAWMVKVVLADGMVDESEQMMLRKAAARRAVPLNRLQEMMSVAARQELQTPEPTDATEARSWLAAMAQMALADGRLDGAEYSLLRKTGQRYGFSHYDVDQVLRQTKKQAYAASRQALREARRPPLMVN